ncbi:MAG TPA: hypothetical protein VFV19_01905 [Candidatus Polarisedimenticolaceae bacterium]|nr:hypothetical protein [Candidatus Polarisedimenticolaceae bacterium]
MSRRVVRCLVVAAVLAAAARGAEAEGVPRAPERLSETGLYLDIASGKIDVWNLPYEPQYPLWTDGAAKARWIRIPDGTTIDVSDPDAWGFPVGTRFWKEFAFAGRKVETRFIWRVTETDWIFASYAWNDEQTEAYLAPAEGLPQHAAIAPGVRHSIPSRTDCLSCHGSSASPILGFSMLQLSDDRDPLAPHAQALKPGMVTLKTLDTFELVSPRRGDWVDDPPAIKASSPVERAALGYLSANCGHCHNGRGPLAGLGMVLAHESAGSRALATTMGVPGDFIVPDAGELTRRIAPGRPDLSAVIYRMSSRRPSSQMPPLGTAVVDRDAVDLFSRWIVDMKEEGTASETHPK